MKIFCTRALESVLSAILPSLPGDSVLFGTTGRLVADIEAQGAADLLIASRSVLDEMALLGGLESGSLADIAGTRVAIAARPGVGALDLSSEAALGKLLLAAGPVAYPDPAGGDVAGAHFAHMLDRLGIGEAVKRHAILVKEGGSAASYLVSGQAALAVQLESELRQMDGIEIVGSPPGELAKIVIFAGAVVAGAAHAREALDAIAALKTPAAAEIIKAAGLIPAQ